MGWLANPSTDASGLTSGTLPAARLPALTGDVTTTVGTAATTLAAGSATNLNAGTLPAARLPALTGDVTTSAGTAATTLAAGNAANLNSGTLAAARLGLALLAANNLSDLGTLATALTALGLTSATWTPKITDATNDATASTALGWYVHIKTGGTYNLVVAGFALVLTNKGSISGNVRLGSLPFTVFNSAGPAQSASGMFNEFDNVTLSTNFYGLGLQGVANGTTALITQKGTVSTGTLTNTGLANNSAFYGIFVFPTAG